MYNVYPFKMILQNLNDHRRAICTNYTIHNLYCNQTTLQIIKIKLNKQSKQGYQKLLKIWQPDKWTLINQLCLC